MTISASEAKPDRSEAAEGEAHGKTMGDDGESMWQSRSKQIVTVLPFGIITSHLALAHQRWGQILREGDSVIDATCGNGKDTLFLAQVICSKGVRGLIIGIDIQKKALDQTQRHLQMNLSGDELNRVHLFHQSHEEFPPLALEHPIRLIVYNLGYLPQGDKELTTLTESTLASLKNGMALLMPEGMISVTCYPGHAEGAKEQENILKWARTLNPEDWKIEVFRQTHSVTAPSLLFFMKKK